MSLINLINFKNKKVLVSGASDGIGYGIAKAFLQEGAEVHVTGTRTPEDYNNDFTGMTFHTLNVMDEAAITELSNQFDSLDVLVNCVGTVLYKKQEFERAGFEKILAINLTGVMHLCTSFFPHLEKAGGNIINLDSVVSVRAALNNPAYSASKAGLLQLTKALAMKWGRKGIRVNSIAPGIIPTKLTSNQTENPDIAAGFAKKNPIPRFGAPEDIAGGALYLASPLASYVTGNQLIIDGGLVL